MMQKINNRIFYKRLVTLALPIGFQQLMLAMVAAADAFMLGRVTQAQMTAVSLATQIQFVQNMIVAATVTAGSILGAQYWGKGDKRTLVDIFHLILKVSAGISFLFFAACEWCPVALMHVFTNDRELIKIGASYLRIAGWSYLLTGISQCYLTVMKVTDREKAGAVISTAAVLLNILFNALLIFGTGIFPRLEARGAALATTLSRVIELLLCVALSFRKDYIKPELKTFFHSKHSLFQDFMRQCLPLLGGFICWGVGFTTYTAIMGHMGPDAAAANSVAAVVRDLICCLCNGIGIAAGIMVGNELGAGRLGMGKAYGIKLKNLSYLLGFFSTALVLLSIPIAVRMIELTPTAKSDLTSMMVILSVYMIGRCVNTVTINGVLDGGGDTLFDMYSLIVTMWLIAIPLAWLGAFFFHWSPLLVYACTCLDEVGKIPWVMVRFRKYKWVQDLTKKRV